MKRLLLSTVLIFNFSFLIFNSANAQAPGKFKYQAVVRDANGAALQNENVAIRFQIYNAPAGGTVEFQEDFSSVNTGNFGVVNLEVGGNPTVGNLATLDWGNSGFYANIQMRPASGGTFTDISDTRSQLVSVPYALYALSAGATGQPVSITGDGATTVTGTFPNFTVSSTDENTTYTAGTNISIDVNNEISASFTEVDGSTTNEIQNLTIAGNQINLSNSSPASITLNFTVNGNEVSLNGTPVFTIPTQTPAGTIVAYGGVNAPAGWVLCDGASYATTGTYANLHAAILYAFGGSGGSFNVPDLRGRFLRGVDGPDNSASDRDPDSGGRGPMNTGGNSGNLVGSVQDDAFESHTHAPNFKNQQGSNTVEGPTGFTIGLGSGGVLLNATEGGSETRPVNAYVNYIIKL